MAKITFGEKTIIKQSAVKVRRLKVRCAGGLLREGQRMPSPYSKSSKPGWSSSRANCCGLPVELAKDWRTDKALRRLEALMIVMNKEHLLLLSGTGEIIEPDDG